MPAQYQTPEQRAINAVCLLIYQLFLIFASAYQPHEIVNVERLENQEVPVFVLRTRRFHEGTTFPLPHADPTIQRAIIVNDRCNLCWLVMKPLLIRLLHIVNPKITVQLMLVIPKPHLLIRINERPPAKYHTIMRITTPGGQFILDLTGEQYGWTNALFLPLDVYLERFCRFVEHGFYRSPMDTSPVMRRTMISEFLAQAPDRFWHKAQITHLRDLEREWRADLPGGLVRREDLVCREQREMLLHRLRELVYGR